MMLCFCVVAFALLYFFSRFGFLGENVVNFYLYDVHPNFHINVLVHIATPRHERYLNLPLSINQSGAMNLIRVYAAFVHASTHIKSLILINQREGGHPTPLVNRV